MVATLLRGAPNSRTLANVLLVVLSLMALMVSAHYPFRPWPVDRSPTPEYDENSFVAQQVAAAASIARSYSESDLAAPERSEAIKVGCYECKLIIGTLQDFLRANKTIEELKKFAIAVCVNFQIEDELVCHGIIREFATEVVYIFTERFLDPLSFCQFFNACHKASPKPPTSISNVNVLAESSRSSSTTAGGFARSKFWPSYSSTAANSSVGYFVQLSDIHFDHRYAEGSNTACGRPLCCRVSDGRGNAGHWGDYQCDTPIRLLTDLLNTVSNYTVVPDFILYTGDSSAHDVWEQTEELQLWRTKYVCSLMLASLPSTMPVYSAVGNHESYPVDQFPNPPANSKLMDTLASSWAPWLPNDTMATIQYGGYYSLEIAPGLVMISLNTQYCDSNNFWLILNWTDPTGQLQWLQQQLQQATDAGKKVWLVGHIPLSDSGCLLGYSTQVWQIIDKYSTTITAQFFGHTHEDSFTVYHDFATNTKPIGISYTAPSVTPYTDKNPSFRIYEYDRNTYEILNYHQYIMNLTDNNANPSSTVRWMHEYSAREAYNMPDLSPDSWAVVAEQLQANNTVVQQFYTYHYTSNVGNTTCDAGCQTSLYCGSISSSLTPYLQCTNITSWAKADPWNAFMNFVCP